MTKLLYNKEQLSNIVMPSLDNGISTLDNAIYNTSFRIPTDFQYYNYMMSLRNTVNKSLQKLKSSKTWLNRSMNRIDNQLEEMETSVANLEDITIRPKDPSVLIID